MGQIGTKRMLDIAKAKAFDRGVVVVKDKDEVGAMVGYCQTWNEIKALFYAHGFTREATMRRYVELWKECGSVETSWNGVVFFHPSACDYVQISELARYEASSFDRMIGVQA